MLINDPAVLAELRRCLDACVKALMAGDAVTLDSLRWDSSHAVRFDVMENLRAGDVILRLDIMAFGDSAGVVKLEFARPLDGVERHGRQTQFWFRFPEGWKIVSAHESLIPAAPSYSYVDATSARIGLPVDPAYRAAVNDDLNRLAGIAEFLMQFPLAQEVEAAAVFQA